MSSNLQRVLAAHAAEIEAIVRRYVDEPADRDDLRQEIAIALWRALPRFRGSSAERTYVLRVAQNRAITFCLRLARRRALTHPLEPVVNELASPKAESGEYDLEHLRPLLAEALRELSMQQTTLLSLSASGHSPSEIARQTGATAGAVRVALHRARGAVRRWLEERGR